LQVAPPAAIIRPVMSRAILVGAGPIGVAAAAGAIDEGVVTGVSGVVDRDPEARATAAARFGAAGYSGVAEIPEAAEGDWVIAAFSSSAEVVAAEIIRLVALGYHVVTTCEELSWPPRHVREAIRTSAVSGGRRVVATGANPGFVMDRLPLAAAGGVRSIRSIRVERRVDTSTRRGPLVAKTGRGLGPEEFERLAGEGSLGHVGLDVSVRLLARGLTWPTHDVVETIEPVIGADGSVAGLHQRAVLRTPEGGVLDFDLTMAWEVDRPGDAIIVDGEPQLRVEIPGGYHGDTGTTAQVVNAIGRHTDLAPGFYRPIDVPLRFS